MGRFAWFAYGFLFCRTYKNLYRLTEHRPMLRKSAGNALPHRVRRCVLFIILRGGRISTAIRAFGCKQSNWTNVTLEETDHRQKKLYVLSLNNKTISERQSKLSKKE